MINSINKKKRCPPSSTGMGSKLIILKLRLSSAIKMMRDAIPVFAALPVIFAITMGPPSILREILKVINFPSVMSVSHVISHDC